MIPTLSGRIQTRIFLLAVIGSIWTAIVTPLLPNPAGASLAELYRGTFVALAAVLVLGLVWELIYHGLQQFRWEKDWPTLFGLLTGIPEGVLLWFLYVQLDPFGFGVPTSTFVAHFATTWFVVWLWANTFQKVLFVRWRFYGGRIV